MLDKLAKRSGEGIELLGRGRTTSATTVWGCAYVLVATSAREGGT